MINETDKGEGGFRDAFQVLNGVVSLFGREHVVLEKVSGFAETFLIRETGMRGMRCSGIYLDGVLFRRSHNDVLIVVATTVVWMLGGELHNSLLHCSFLFFVFMTVVAPLFPFILLFDALAGRLLFALHFPSPSFSPSPYIRFIAILS